MSRSKISSDITTKELIIFDLDGTLTQSKSPLEKEMASLIEQLLSRKKVAVISGGKKEQFDRQFLAYIPTEESLLENLIILPTSGTSMYRFVSGEWKKIYEETLLQEERNKIIESLKRAWRASGIQDPEEIFGEQIEDRGSQVTFSALGQDAPVDKKSDWDDDLSKRKILHRSISDDLPEHNVAIGGTTSIDITKKGMDKGFGILKLAETSETSIEKMIFVGDQMGPNGNDFPVIRTGIDWMAVEGPEETKEIIKKILL